MKKDYIFIFDLDSTISKIEILPEIAKILGKQKEIRKITEDTMQGLIPFKYSFLNRVDLLKEINVSLVNEIVSKIPLNEKIVGFIKKNREKCYIVTGNLDVWIKGLMTRIDMLDHCFCSKTMVINDKIEKVVSVIDKGLQIEQFVQPLVVIGDGDNDAEMARYANIAIGFGGVRNIAPALLNNIDYAFYDENVLVLFLEKLAKE